MRMIVAMILAAVAMAGPAWAQEIACKAERRIDCSARGCASALDDTIQVEFTLDPATRRGELCTYTYCRSFVLIAEPGGEGGAELSGFTVSAASGSTPPHDTMPVIDYQLSIDAARSGFLLGAVSDGAARFSAGPCAPR